MNGGLIDLIDWLIGWFCLVSDGKVGWVTDSDRT